MKFLFALIIISSLLFPVHGFAQENENDMLIHIGPIQQECISEAVMNCLVIREIPNGELNLFYDVIVGFEYEAGYEYLLRVKVSNVENPLADTSSLHYELIEILRQLPASLTDTLWVLQSFDDYMSVNMDKFTLLFDETTTVAITSDCNSFLLSNYNLNSAEIIMTGMTEMACGNSIEGNFVNALSSIYFWTIENGELIITSDEGKLHFSSQDINDIEWSLQSYQSEEFSWIADGIVSYTLWLNGTEARGQLACNDGNGTVEQEGSILRIDLITPIFITCMDEPLAGLYPPQEVTSSVNADGQLILKTANNEIFTFISSE